MGFDASPARSNERAYTAGRAGASRLASTIALAAVVPALASAPFEPQSMPTTTPYIVSSTQRIGGAMVHWFAAGPPGGNPVILLHGGRYSAKNWVESGLLAALAESGFRAVAVDWPGFGASEKQDIRPSELLAALAKSLAIERPVIVAPSMSGRFAFEFTAAEPPPVAGLILVAPADWEASKGRLKTLNVPTLVVWGENDEVFPVSQAAELASLIPGARRVVLPRARHACWRDAPAEFNAEAVNFLLTLPRATTRPASRHP